MKKYILLSIFATCLLTSYSQSVKGYWVLENLIVKGGKFNDFDKMLLGEGLEIHLGDRSHLGITVLNKDKTKTKHKDSWFEGETFIILNDALWGNVTYNILKINKKEIVLERFVSGGIEIILEFERRTHQNHHHHVFKLVNG